MLPVLVLGEGLAVPQLHHCRVGAGVVSGDVDALAAGACDGALRSVGHVGLAAVADGDDVGLHGGLGGGPRETAPQDALEEGAHVRVAVVTADTQDDAALLVHRNVAATV